MSKQKETKFKERILPLLKKLPSSWVLKTQETSRRGTPDLILCVKGKFIAIELKTDEGAAAELQEFNLSCIAMAGGVSMIITPSSWPKDYEYLQQLAA